MHEKPKLQVTRNYDLFEMHPLNREFHERPILSESMKQHGFMPSSPIHCISNGKGKLRVIRGHHRLDYAKKYKLPVWYVIDSSNTNIYDLEGDSHSRWSLEDFMKSRARSGDEACMEIVAFQEKHLLTLGSAIGLLGGETAGSTNSFSKVKKGTFKVAADLTHARAVVNITDHLLGCGLKFATQTSFVNAVSMILRVPEFDAALLKHRISKTPGLIEKRTDTRDYLDMIEAAYNYAAKGKRVPLAFRAREVARLRHLTFGGRNKAKQPAIGKDAL